MMKKFHLMILIIIIIISVKLFNSLISTNIIEHYDARLKDQSLERCANFCKTINNCYGFGYDHEKSICYPAQEIITSDPFTTLYYDQYDRKHFICNKVKPLIEPDQNPSFKDRKSNATFACSEKEKQPQLYLHDQDKLTNIDEGQNSDYLTEMGEYSVRRYRWPTNKFEKGQEDLVQEFKDKQGLKPSVITDLERYNTPVIINKEIIRPIVKEPTKDYTSYRIHRRMNDSKYLDHYKCMQNVPRRQCLDYCSDLKDCVGIEWNPQFMHYSNVCCPMKSVNLVPRTLLKKNGRFFLKSMKKKLNVDTDYLHY